VDITEVRIKLMEDPQERLQAFCSITFNACFVIRDLKIIQGAKGPFVAMPSRKLTDRCPKCHGKNHLRAQHCNQCGAKLDEERATRDSDGRAKLYADIAHPINSDCRELIQRRVLEEFASEQVRSKQPDYVCTYDDYGEDRYATLKYPYEEVEFEERPSQSQSAAKPTTIPGSGDSRHRIEPAQDLPASPHHGIAANGSRQTASAGRRERGDDDDAFGAGL